MQAYVHKVKKIHQRLSSSVVLPTVKVRSTLSVMLTSWPQLRLPSNRNCHEITQNFYSNISNAFSTWNKKVSSLLEIDWDILSDAKKAIHLLCFTKRYFAIKTEHLHICEYHWIPHTYKALSRNISKLSSPWLLQCTCNKTWL